MLRSRRVVRGTVVHLFLLALLVLLTAYLIGNEHDGKGGVSHGVELYVVHDRSRSVPVPVLTTGGPPTPPVDWPRVRPEQSDGESWVLNVQILPVDPRRLITVRVVDEVDAAGVPVTEPMSFTCGDGSSSEAVSCTAGGDGLYMARWPRSLGARVAISSDLPVGSEIRYTTWAMHLSSPDDVD